MIKLTTLIVILVLIAVTSLTTLIIIEKRKNEMLKQNKLNEIKANIELKSYVDNTPVIVYSTGNESIGSNTIYEAFQRAYNKKKERPVI